MKKIEDLSLEELEWIQEYLKSFYSIWEVRKDLNHRILQKEKELNKNMNFAFDLDMFSELRIFSDEELHILQIHGIDNLQDLMDADLESFLDLEWKKKLKRIITLYGDREKEKSPKTFHKNNYYYSNMQGKQDK